MKRDNYMSSLNEIQGFTKKIRTINEAISFNDEYDGYDNFENEPDEEAMGQQKLGKMQGEEPMNGPRRQQMMQGGEGEDAEDVGMRNLDQAGELDQIREICLKGMIKFCKNPEDPTYQALKKIFQMVDKGVEKEVKEQQQQ